MRRSWLGLQLVLSCALLLAALAVGGRCCEEEESSSEEECPSERRHHCVEECCHHHEEEECCWEKWCHHHHGEEECCWEKWCHHHEEEECCCQKRHHHEDEESSKKKHSHGKEESAKKKHSHGKEASAKKKHSHVEEEEKEADKSKEPHAGKKPPRKSLLEMLEESSEESSEVYERMVKEEQKRTMELAAQTSDAVPHYRREQALAHFNRGSEGDYYRHLEDGQLEFKKAIGVMVYVKVILVKTNCTKPEEQEVAGEEYSRAYLEKEGCQPLPKLKQEKHSCTFGIFVDMRTEKKTVVSQECIRIPGINQLFNPLLNPLKGLAF